ncbi:MAG: hypothetical protein L6Q98_17315 [Anaerolineae bacterium]|nr:hypothetical protein [Anaerolineae bacterium]NUQ04500.1 hypothetical protein [Anaerolineae bacterium]
MRRLSTLILTILLVIAVMVTALLTYGYLSFRSRLEDKAVAAAQTQAVAASEHISAAFGEVMSTAALLAAELEDGALPYSSIETRLREIAADRPNIDGIAITFEPFAYDPDLRLFQTYVYKLPDGMYDALVGATYDYTQTPNPAAGINTGWYVDTLREGAQWHEPFFATGAQKILVEYGLPFAPLGGQGEGPAGIISIDYTLQDMSALIRALELGATGYGFVISAEGRFLAHPVREYMVNRTIFEVGSDEALTEAARLALGGASQFVEIPDPITGETTWHFFEPIGATGWSIGIVLDSTHFLPDARQTVRDQMTIALAAASAIFLAATLLFHVDHFHFTNFWTVSGVFSMLCVALIALAWTLTNRLEVVDGTSITSPSQMDRYLEGLTSANPAAAPLRVPTGILIQSLQFPDATSVTINGYIWQRYPVDSPLQRGFALPQRTGEEATLDEVSRRRIGDEEVITWYVGVTLRQSYDPTRFPFDHRLITIRLAPADLNAAVILIPDLDAYDLISPRLLPGVDPQAGVNNWSLQTSRFAYTAAPITTSLGMTRDEAAPRSAELRFSIQAQRVSLGPFIAYLLPGLIAAAMTFAYLMSGHEPGKAEQITNALNYAAALFFVVAVIHTALRDQVAAVGITYMEVLYMLLYVAIVAVAANIFAVARRAGWAIVRYRNNIAPKVLYWPVFAGVMLIATLAVFVYC